MRNNFLTAGVLLAVLVTGPVARAYDIIRAELTPFEVRIVKWLPGVIPMQIKLGTAAVLQDGTNHSTSVLEAMNDWNAVIGRVQFEGTIAAAGVGGGSTNGINEIFFSNTVYGTAFGSNTIAVMLSSRSMTLETDGTFRRTQADIIFNSARLWNSYRGATQSGLTDIRRVALHELGHVLGLDHPDDVSQSVNAVMNSTISNIDSLQRDDREGAQFLYQPPGPIVRPVNDDFADAIALTLTEDAVQGTIVSTNATKEPGEPNHVTTRVGGASVWWQWTAIENGDLTASTPGTTFDTQLAVYTGSAVDALNLIASHDDISVSFNRTSTATFAVNSGTTYHIAIDGREGESGTVKLNLNFKSAIPRITTQPVNRRIQEFQSTTFFVAAVGAPPLTYQWQYRSVGGEWSNLPDGSGVAGTTAALLNLTAVTRARAGEYRCLVSTARGAAASAAATLIVDMASPKIVTQPQSQTVARGGTATLTAVVSGSEPMIFRWQKTTGNQVIAGATSATLVIPNIQFSDQDSYRLTVTNEAGSITSNYTWLTVIDLPQIATQPKGQTVFRTTPFWLAVSLGSGGSVTYQWFRNGAPIAGATSSEYSVASAEEAHAGSYTVAVTNVAGTTLSDAAEIEVIALPPPQNIRIGSNPTVPLGVDISIGITASQTWGPSLSYQWYRNGVAIPGATLSYYSASNATVASFGEYYVTITNASGTGVSNTQSISYRHPRFNESSAQYWVAAQEVDGVVYFFFQDTPRVTRYDLASETWLSTWTLPSAPRAVAFATDAIYVASATEVVRYSRELLNPTSLLALADIRSLLVRGEQLLVAAGNNSPANYRTINRQTGQQISTLAMYGGASNGAAYSQIDQGIYFINTNSSSARLERLVWREDGTFGSYVTVTDLSRSLNGRQAFVVRNGSLVIDNGGGIFHTDTHSLYSGLGGAFDHVLEVADGGWVLVRAGQLARFDAAGKESGMTNFAISAQFIALKGQSVIGFARPTAAGTLPSVQKLALAAVQPSPLAASFDPRNRALWSPEITTDGIGNLYIYSKLDRAVVRWSVYEGRYLATVPLRGSPDWVAMSPAHQALFYEQRGVLLRKSVITELGKVGADAPFFSSFLLVQGLHAADRHLFANDQTWGHFALSPLGKPQHWGSTTSYSRQFVWSERARRMLFYANFSPSSLTTHTISSSGQILATLGSNSDTELMGWLPMRLSPDGQRASLGSGQIYDVVSLKRLAKLPRVFTDTAWTTDKLNTVRAVAGGAELQTWNTNSGNYTTERTTLFSGYPVALFQVPGERLTLVTTVAGILSFRLIDPTTHAVIDPAIFTGAPEVLRQPQSTSVVPGEPATFAVAARGGANPSYRWRRNGVPLSDNTNYSGTTGAVLTLLSANIADEGDYDVVITNGAGNTTSVRAQLWFSQLAQTIDFPVLNDRPVTSDPFSLIATATSGLLVDYSVVSGPATINNNIVTLTSLGVVTIRATQIGNALYAGAASVTQSFQARQSYTHWLAQSFTFEQRLDLSRTGSLADFDGDGVSNLMEYALGRNPKIVDLSVLPAVAAAEVTWEFTYTRPADRDDLTYQVEQSTNLLSWTTDGVTHIRVTTGTTETWRATVPRDPNSPAPHFFRLKITQH